jgi:hypothetical protein
MASIPDFRRKWKPIMLPEKKIDSSGCSFYQKCPFGRAEWEIALLKVYDGERSLSYSNLYG